MTMVKPPRLSIGDTIAILSPSAGLPAIFPTIYENGLANLRDLFGVEIKEMPTARMDADTLYRHPQRRADDINTAFADPNINAIITSIGGEDSVRILPFLDMDIIRANPKIIMGFSDATTFLTYLNQHGLVTFNGPSIMAGISQLGALPEAATEHIRTMLMTDFEQHTYQTYGNYSDGYPDWGVAENLGKVHPPHKEEIGWQWVQGTRKTQGRLFGGCIEVLEFMKATPFWPAPDFWDDRILFFETSEDAPPINNVRYFLRNYGSQGIFDRINGILFGRAQGYSREQKQALVAMIRSVLDVEFGRPDLTVVANLDFGHTDPQWIMPNGTLIEIDADAQQLALKECPTQ